MPVHYCLGLEDGKFAKCAHPANFGPLLKELRKEIEWEPFTQLAQLPSFAWNKPEALKSHLIARLSFSSHVEARAFQELLKSSGSRGLRYGFGQDPIISDMDSWSPVGPGGGIFGDRDVADGLTGVPALRSATGKGVNVIIVDRGLCRDWVGDTIKRMASKRRLKGTDRAPDVLGWTRYEWTSGIERSIVPGTTRSIHGHMIARNILAAAPEATIWDAPLLPLEDEKDAPPGPSIASDLFHRIKHDVSSRKLRDAGEPWIMVNAWGVLDPESDRSFQGYADDPDHLLVNDMKRLDDAGIDVVFAAGNCGEPCPDRRCGSQDTGPGRSIFGLNAHPNVLTVGAVRSDGLPIALSAQGPGRLATRGSRGKTDYTHNKRAQEKPDLCAPSHFRESDDASEDNTGTSAACGFAAGILAALRSVPRGRNLTPEEMRTLLRQTSRRPAGQPDWDPRLGFGIINAEDALARLV